MKMNEVALKEMEFAAPLKRNGQRTGKGEPNPNFCFIVGVTVP
ncbi:MAG: hypothetical protein ACFFD4_34900 [Candidatus Odinarchaeota archaeon]